MKVVIHASTSAALRRARAHAVNLQLAHPDAAVRIVADSEGAEAAVAERDPSTDLLIVLCASSLERAGMHAPADFEVTPTAIELLARLQRKGWAYVRA